MTPRVNWKSQSSGSQLSENPSQECVEPWIVSFVHLFLICCCYWQPAPDLQKCHFTLFTQKINSLLINTFFMKLKPQKKNTFFFYLKNFVTSHSNVLICANCAIATVVNNKNNKISQCSEEFPGWNSECINQSTKQPEWFNEAWCQISMLPESSSSSQPRLHHLLTLEALFLSRCMTLTRIFVSYASVSGATSGTSQSVFHPSLW